LTWLETVAQFYLGESFIMICVDARRSDKTLYESEQNRWCPRGAAAKMAPEEDLIDQGISGEAQGSCLARQSSMPACGYLLSEDF
jgi:hypothetical protein